MAELYLARATGIEGFEKLVALKRILPQHAQHEDFVHMFLDEARLAATIQHANVAQVYDIGRCDDGLFFTMEFVHGEDVRTVMQTMGKRSRALPLEHALSIAIGAAAGLHAAHQKLGHDGALIGLVHRDVSPSNLLVSFDGCVKIIDFGIAKAERRQTETRAGTLKGKIAYMSPEQCLGDAIDRRSDVFSLGVVLYEMTTGARLFPVDNEYAAMRQIVDEDAPPPSKRKQGYPPELEAIVLRALRRNRSERYGSTEELQLALEGFVRARGLAVSTAQLGFFMRDLFPERALDLQGLTPPPAHDRRVLPLRARTATPLSVVTPTPMSIDALPGRPPTAPSYHAGGDDLALFEEPALDAPLEGGMFRASGSPPMGVKALPEDLEPSIAIEVDAAPAPARRRWLLPVIAGVTASISALIAAVIILLMAGSRSAAPAAPPVPAAAPTSITLPIVVPIAAPEPVAAPVVAPAPPAPAPTPERARKHTRAKQPKKKAPKGNAAWNPDSALPPM
jgi:serine/threonine protein kinase